MLKNTLITLLASFSEEELAALADNVSSMKEHIGSILVKKVESVFFPTTVDNSIGLINLLYKAVGPNNLRNIDKDITPERFKIGNGVRKVNLELAISNLKALGSDVLADVVKVVWTDRIVNEIHQSDTVVNSSREKKRFQPS